MNAPQNARPFWDDFFVYTVSFLAANLTAGSTVNQLLQIDASADFVWLQSSYTCDVARAGQTESTRVYPLATVLLTPTDSSSQLMNAAVPVTSIFGNGESPFILSRPRVLAAQTSLTVQVANIDAAQAYNLQLSLIGVKRFRGGR